MIKYFSIIVILAISLNSCSEPSKNWQLSKTISINGINPIGITSIENDIWLSDGDHNRVVRIDETGNIMFSIDSLERPMHISAYNNDILIPQYGNDIILNWSQEQSNNLSLNDSLDAPAGVWKYKEEIAIADFYNHRILYTQNGEDWINFGKEGNKDGEFYYPTDVQITENEIYVADAYNNRIQVFNKKGKFNKMIGIDQKMNATTGIFVSEDRIFATDFENDRVLVFDLDGNLIQDISDSIEKPTDLIIFLNKLYVINYRNSQINVFELKNEIR